MSDTVDPVQPSAELKQSRTVDKSGARDSKRLKNNANRDIEAPAMPDAEQELSIAERMGTRGHGAKQPQIVERVLRLAEQGFSQTEICKKIKISPRTLNTWLREQPEFQEDFKERYRSYIDDQARQLVPLASRWGNDSETLRILLERGRRLSRLKGLKPTEKIIAHDRAVQREIDASSAIVNAQEKKFHRILQAAGRQLPQDWGEHADVAVGMVIIDAGLHGPIKTTGLPGSPDGQNVKALKAGRWKELPSPEEVGKP